jgi:hypothetical protein
VDTVTAIPFGTVPAETDPDTAAPHLRLVSPTAVTEHEHAWRLLSVDFDDTFEVRRYECETCSEVLFR